MIRLCLPVSSHSPRSRKSCLLFKVSVCSSPVVEGYLISLAYDCNCRPLSCCLVTTFCEMPFQKLFDGHLPLIVAISGAVHMEMLLCVNSHFASFCPIVHMDPVNTFFFKRGPRVEKSENAALSFSCGRRIRILWVSMIRSSLQPLNPATYHDDNNNKNNNVGLYACVHAAVDVEHIRFTRGKKNFAPLPLL